MTKETTPAKLSLRAQYDGAKTTRHNEYHWSHADFKSADLDANALTRKTLRIRARYESQNNSYARGICKSIAADTIGTGPHLQVDGDDDFTRRVEEDWQAWAKAINLLEKLRTARYNKLIDGEAFILFRHNPKIDNPVQLDLQLIDADRVTSPNQIDPFKPEGVVHDQYGNPIAYTVFDRHPTEILSSSAYKTVSADNIIHLYESLRAGQSRGVSELAPCINLFGQLRTYTSTVLTAAQTAASLTGVIATDAPAGGEATDLVPMETIELSPGQLLTMPAGWDLSMTKAEQPTANYASFKQELLSEIARCLEVPYNIAAGNSNEASYASSRLDWQIYHKAIRLQQQYFADNALNRIYKEWYKEWRYNNPKAPKEAPKHGWIWDSINEHSDPYKQAHAEAVAIQHNTTTLASIYAEKGLNWETEIRQIARERKALVDLGLGLPPQTFIATPLKEEHKDEDES